MKKSTFAIRKWMVRSIVSLGVALGVALGVISCVCQSCVYGPDPNPNHNHNSGDSIEVSNDMPEENADHQMGKNKSDNSKDSDVE